MHSEFLSKMPSLGCRILCGVDACVRGLTPLGSRCTRHDETTVELITLDELVRVVAVCEVESTKVRVSFRTRIVPTAIVSCNEINSLLVHLDTILRIECYPTQTPFQLPFAPGIAQLLVLFPIFNLWYNNCSQFMSMSFISFVRYMYTVYVLPVPINDWINK